MTDLISRLRHWWSWSPGPESYRPAPVDTELMALMVGRAEELAAMDTRLDYSVDSLAAVERDLASEPELIAAYLGEVLRRNSGDRLRWSTANREHGLALGMWVVPLDEIVDRAAADVRPRLSYVESAQETLTFAADPSEETAQRLGWRTVAHGTTAWEDLKARWSRWRDRRSAGD